METVVIFLTLLVVFIAGMAVGCVVGFVFGEEPAGVLRVVTLESGEPPNLFLELERDFDFSENQRSVKFDLAFEDYISRE